MVLFHGTSNLTENHSLKARLFFHSLTITCWAFSLPTALTNLWTLSFTFTLASAGMFG